MRAQKWCRTDPIEDVAARSRLNSCKHRTKGFPEGTKGTIIQREMALSAHGRANPPRYKEPVPERGLEPPRPCGHRILSPARLPIPPLRHGVRFTAFVTSLNLRTAAAPVNPCRSRQGALKKRRKRPPPAHGPLFLSPFFPRRSMLR